MIYSYSDWLLLIIQPFLQNMVSFLANFLLAVAVFIIGYLISMGIGRVIAEILRSIRFNRLFEKEGWSRAFQKANVQVNPSEFIGAIFKWVFVILSLLLAVDILQLTAFSGVLVKVLDYLPNVLVAALIFVVAVVISDIIEKLVRVAIEKMKIGHGYLASSIVKWAIWIFTMFLILDQLLPNSLLVKTLYMAIVYGIVGTISLGLALAIGLGGKDIAHDILSDMKEKMSHNK